MGILDRLARRRAGVTVRVVGVEPHVMGMTPGELYETQPALRAVVSFLATNIAQLPVKVYRAGPDDGRDRVRDGVLAETLRSPCHGVTTYELMERTVVDVKLYGRAIWYVHPSADTESGWAVEHVPYEWVKAKTRDGLTVDAYEVTSPETSATVTIPAADVVAIGYYDPTAPAAAPSPVSALKDVLAEQVSAWRFRNQVWANGGRIASYLYRPLGAAWGEGAFDRFIKSWREYSGNNGGSAGKTPLLEDGMELRQVQFNAREAEWVEATQLSRQDVAAVYHVNPSLVWHSDAQTYASARDNARALYADTLAPDLKMIADAINGRLAPMIGADTREYAEIDIQGKLAGSFEEQAALLTQAVGGPWMSAAEARARMNLPFMDGTDVILQPLNMTTADAVTVTGEPDELAYAPALTCGCGCKDHGPEPVRVKGAPETADALEVARVLRRFYKRQGKAVVSRLDNPKFRDAATKDGDWPAWWDAERWDRELADDLEPVLVAQATRRGRRTMRRIGLDADAYDADRTRAYLRAMAEGKAKAANNVTYRQLVAAIDGDLDEDAEGSTPRGVFEKAETDRADTQGASWSTAVAGWASMEAVRQGAPDRRATKTWRVTSGNPRPEHARMDGETVAMGEEFSNGAQYPGDQTLTPDESCNCQCQVEILVY